MTSESYRTVSGSDVVYPSPHRNVANRAVGRIWARSATSRIVVPTHSLSKVVQPVTQWKGDVTFAEGRRRNSSYVRRSGFSTEPSTRRSHSFGSNRGTMPRSSRGHFRTSRCPGGNCRSATIAREQRAPSYKCPARRLEEGPPLKYAALNRSDSLHYK